VVAGDGVVTVIVPLWERPYVSLLYNPNTSNQTDWYRVEDGQAAVTFQGCPPNVIPWPEKETQFNGGFVVAGTRCVVLDVQWSDQVRTMRFSWGAPCSG
jgi:hypothetical protein